MSAAPNKTTFHPESKIVSVWEISTAVVLVWTCIVVPLKLGWDSWFDSDAWTALDALIDTFFICGVAFNFFVGFRRDGGLVEMDRKKIARRYLRGWCVPAPRGEGPPAPLPSSQRHFSLSASAPLYTPLHRHSHPWLPGSRSTLSRAYPSTRWRRGLAPTSPRS